jgi:hypothetical protein
MATVRSLTIADGTTFRPKGEVSATVRLIEVGGEKFVQIDTYGGPNRQEVGKQSQSIRLSRVAFDQLVQLGSKHF